MGAKAKPKAKLKTMAAAAAATQPVAETRKSAKRKR